MNCLYKYFFIFGVIGGSAFASDVGASDLYPSCLKGVKEIYTARQVGLGWKRFTISPDPDREYHIEYFAELFYVPEKRVALAESLDSQIKPRIEVDPKKIPIALAPAGYFIAYAAEGTIWLVTVERYCFFIKITRLKQAGAEDEPVFSRLYWPDLEEPRFKSQSQSLYELLPKDSEGKADGVR